MHTTTPPIIIANARPSQASRIATLIMEAMNHECCQYFAGPQHSLADFHRMMTRLVSREDSQYSYLNTLVAVAEQPTGGDADTEVSEVVGICVSYDGALLRPLRQAFVEEALTEFGIDHSGMDDETQAGELYVDSLAVDSRYRRHGIASALLRATCEKAARLCLPAAGLLVDKGNPQAERLYKRLGFRFVEDAEWGGHPMKHLQRAADKP